jgi:hypothetical protein
MQMRATCFSDILKLNTTRQANNACVALGLGLFFTGRVYIKYSKTNFCRKILPFHFIEVDNLIHTLEIP